ncbi:MAG: LysR family transcriptional regulator [Azospirillum sp.]|nr:LysR family transcriptional regulator [Azospirillum sp.]
MIRDLDIRLLRAFTAVAESGSITVSARQLNRSQPAVSQQIRALEEQLGYDLFQRSHEGLQLNRAGQQIMPQAVQILRLNDLLLSRKRESVRPVLRIGLPEEFAERYLCSVLEEFQSRGGTADVEVELGLSRNLLLGLHDGKYDIILGKQPISAPRGHACAEQLTWVAGENFKLAGRALPLVLFSEACLYRRTAVESLSGADVQWQIVCTGSSWVSLRAAVIAGLGLSVMSSDMLVPGIRPVANDSWHLPPLPSTSLVLLRAPQSKTPDGELLADLLWQAVERRSANWDPHRDAASA